MSTNPRLKTVISVRLLAEVLPVSPMWLSRVTVFAESSNSFFAICTRVATNDTFSETEEVF
jgi:hypothetical protein